MRITGEVYANPASRFVADFIGISNIYGGKVVRRATDTLVEVEGRNGIRLLATTREPLEEGTPVWLTIRPEHISVLKEGVQAQEGGAAAVSLRGVVRETVFSGDRTEIRLDIASPGAEHPMPLSFFAHDAPAIGDEIHVAVPAAAAVAVREGDG